MNYSKNYKKLNRLGHAYPGQYHFTIYPGQYHFTTYPGQYHFTTYPGQYHFTKPSELKPVWLFFGQYSCLPTPEVQNILSR